MFEIHGEIVTVPAEKGDIRNLTNSPAIADRDPAWSPDGKRIAWFSDESGDYALHIRDQNGLGNVTKVDLGSPPSYFYSPVWSPDNKKIAYTDKRLNLWYVDLEKGAPIKIDTDYYDSPFHTLNPAWSPDSKWVAYTKQLPSHLHAAVHLRPGVRPRATRSPTVSATRSMPDWDKGGKYLYLTASTDVGRAASWLDMSSYRSPGHAQCLPGGAVEGRSLAARARERRRKIRRSEKRAVPDEGQDRQRPRPTRPDKDKPKAPPVSADRFREHRPAHPGAAVPGRNYQGLQPAKKVNYS